MIKPSPGPSDRGARTHASPRQIDLSISHEAGKTGVVAACPSIPAFLTHPPSGSSALRRGAVAADRTGGFQLGLDVVRRSVRPGGGGRDRHGDAPRRSERRGGERQRLSRSRDPQLGSAFGHAGADRDRPTLRTIDSDFAYWGQNSGPSTAYIDYTIPYPSESFEILGIPEPATWAMMLVGFVGLGGTLRSRRRMATASA